MPCTMTGSIEGDRSLSVREAQDEASNTTKLLCKACKLLDKSKDTTIKMPKDLRAWWNNHQKIDRQEYENRIRFYAISKLNSEERKVLGV